MANSSHHLKYFLLINFFSGTLSSYCNILRNVHVIPRHRCFADKQVYSNITPIHHYSCRQNCITNKRCLYVQHHVVRNYCIVSNGPCLWLEPDSDYNVTFIRTKSVDNCVKWVPQSNLFNAARKHDACFSGGIENRIGRINIQSNILVGQGVDREVYTVLNGADARSTTSEWLDVQPGCKVSWIPFTSGDPIPNGAVQGGYLYNSDIPQPIYVMGAIKTGSSCTAYGYYDPGTRRGYFEYWGVNECTEMFLMIIDWYYFFKGKPEYHSLRIQGNGINDDITCWFK